MLCCPPQQLPRTPAVIFHILLVALCVQARAIARQLLESVAFMHDLQVVHTDLKPGGWVGGWAADVDAASMWSVAVAVPTQAGWMHSGGSVPSAASSQLALSQTTHLHPPNCCREHPVAFTGARQAQHGAQQQVSR